MSAKIRQSQLRKSISPPDPAAADPSAAAERVLDAVGITETEERLYEVLLDQPGISLSDLIESIELSRRKVQSLLKALELKGLITHAPDCDQRYFPTPPDVAIEVLIARHQEALQQVRVKAARLRERARKAVSRNPDERPIEIVRGKEAQAAIFSQIQRAARDEVIAFDRPPYVVATSEMNRPEFEAMSRGVRYRGIYGGKSVELPNAARRIRACVQAGEEARVFHTVPLKLVGADHRVAMLPLDLHHLEGAALLVRSSSLLDALYELFEATWVRAAPIYFAPSGALEFSESEAPGAAFDAERLVPLLAAGLNDKSIADQLGISPRTLDRRMKDFMQSMDARTRFQAGWMAALHLSSQLQLDK